MPTRGRKSKSKGKFKRSGYKKKGQKLTNNNLGLQPLPSRYICKMKYSQTFTIDSLNPIQTMNLNSIYDPDRTGSGHQPNSFDQLAALYNRYRVISTSYAINVTSSSPVRFCVLPTNNSPSVATMSDACERPRAKWAIQYPGGSTQTLKGKVYIPALMGRTKTQYMADDSYQAQVNNNPSELALLNILSKDLTDGTVTVNGVITMTFIVEFFDIITQSQS